MGKFSPEIRRETKARQNNRCALLNLEVTNLEGHHCVPVCLGGSNNAHNCVELAGDRSRTKQGEPVVDVHEVCDRKALNERLFLHPDTLEFVTRDEMPDDCFRNKRAMDFADMPVVRKRQKKKHHRR